MDVVGGRDRFERTEEVKTWLKKSLNSLEGDEGERDWNMVTYGS